MTRTKRDMGGNLRREDIEHAKIRAKRETEIRDGIRKSELVANLLGVLSLVVLVGWMMLMAWWRA